MQTGPPLSARTIMMTPPITGTSTSIKANTHVYHFLSLSLSLSNYFSLSSLVVTDTCILFRKKKRKILFLPYKENDALLKTKQKTKKEIVCPHTFFVNRCTHVLRLSCFGVGGAVCVCGLCVWFVWMVFEICRGTNFIVAFSYGHGGWDLWRYRGMNILGFWTHVWCVYDVCARVMYMRVVCVCVCVREWCICEWCGVCVRERERERCVCEWGVCGARLWCINLTTYRIGPTLLFPYLVQNKMSSVFWILFCVRFSFRLTALVQPCFCPTSVC